METKQAVILMNLGSPDSTSVKDVRRYLKEFLMDERVIDIPRLPRTLLVKGIIAPFRAPKSAAAYSSIWTDQGSPLIVISKNLQAGVQAQLDIPVKLAMRYGNPSGKNVLAELHREHPGLKDILLVPLYPHYAMSSYETAVVQLEEIHRLAGYSSHLSVIRPYYNNDAYIEVLANTMRPYLQNFDKLVLSYHGVPERHIRKGDTTGCHCLKAQDCCNTPSPAHAQCYRHQTFQTTELVRKSLNLPKDKVEQTFQSRLGRDPWLQPYTAARLAELPKEGVKKIAVACPAFVSDCLETLEEIAEGGKHIFMEAGGESFTMIPCLNTDENWIKTIVKWVKDYQTGYTGMLRSN